MDTLLHTDTLAVRRHYESHITDIEATLCAVDHALDELGAPATSQSLAALDQFHAGGRSAASSRQAGLRSARAWG